MRESYEPKLGCEEVILDLPWLLNGSLDDSRAEDLRRHVETCESCKSELQEAREAAQLFGAHIPSLDLVRHALGRPLPSHQVRELERHLSVCSECREDLGLIREESSQDAEGSVEPRVLDFPAAASTDGGRGKNLRRIVSLSGLAAAACTLLILAIHFWPVAHQQSMPTLLVHANPGSASVDSSHQSSSVPVLDGEIGGGVFVHGFENGLETWSEVVGASAESGSRARG